MVTIRRVPTVLSTCQEDSGRNCLGNCCLPATQVRKFLPPVRRTTVRFLSQDPFAGAGSDEPRAVSVRCDGVRDLGDCRGVWFHGAAERGPPPQEAAHGVPRRSPPPALGSYQVKLHQGRPGGDPVPLRGWGR